MPVSEKTFKQIALEDGDNQWELVCGRLRRKPAMTQPHNSVMTRLGQEIGRQLDDDLYELRVNAGHTKTGGSFYVPDVMVLPRTLSSRWAASAGLETYPEPLPFVAEVWSKSTGEYDVEEKFPEYRRRGDLEVWRIHPTQKHVRIWRRGDEGSYAEREATNGQVLLAALPVTVDLDWVFKFVP